MLAWPGAQNTIQGGLSFPSIYPAKVLLRPCLAARCASAVDVPLFHAMPSRDTQLAARYVGSGGRATEAARVARRSCCATVIHCEEHVSQGDILKSLPF